LDEARRLPGWTAALASDDAGTGVLIAEQAGTIVGVISFAPSRHDAFGGRTEIRHLYIAQSVQGQGVGRRLLGDILDRKDLHPGNGVALAVVRQNEKARLFYQKMGGMEIGRFIDPGPLWKSENIVVAWNHPSRTARAKR